MNSVVSRTALEQEQAPNLVPDSVSRSAPVATPVAAAGNSELSLQQQVEVLRDRYGNLQGADLLRVMITEEFPGRIAMVSSFGAEAAVLLDLVATINPDVPVLFVDTRKLFGETLRYRNSLKQQLGLTNIITIHPDDGEIAQEDRDGVLWQRDNNACCNLRKVRPLAKVLDNYDVWISGQKRFQADTRANIGTIEIAGSRIKVNPLAHWSQEQVDEAFASRNLPAHPLVADGYLSIGCLTCTDRVAEGGEARSGRWTGSDKTECGLHMDGSGI